AMARTLQDMFECRFELGILELEACRRKSQRLDVGAGEQHLISEFTKGQSRGESRQRKDRRAAQQPAQSLRKLAIGGRVRRRAIHRSAHGCRGEKKLECSDQVVNHDPTDVLPAAANDAADSELE